MAGNATQAWADAGVCGRSICALTAGGISTLPMSLGRISSSPISTRERSGPLSATAVPTPSDPETVEGLLLAPQILHRVGEEHAARLEEAVQLVAGLEAEQAAQFGLCRASGLLLRNPHAASARRHVASGAEALGQFVGNR